MITMHIIGSTVLLFNPMRSHLAYLVHLLLKKQKQLQQDPDVQDMASKGQGCTFMMTFTVWRLWTLHARQYLHADVLYCRCCLVVL